MIAIVDATLHGQFGYLTVQVIRDGVVVHDAELPSQIVRACRETYPLECQKDLARVRRMMVGLGYTVLDGEMQPVEV